MVAGRSDARRAELAQLRAVADSVVSSATAAIAVVTGDAGIGKTTLVDHFVDQLRSNGFTVLRTSGSAAETQLTWAGLHSLLHHDIRPSLDGLPRPQRDAVQSALGLTDSALEPGLVAAGLAGTIAALAAVAPVAIVVDDLHWLDAATAGVTAFAVRATGDLPVLTVLAHRPNVPLPLDGQRLLPADRVTRVPLVGLSAAGVHRVVLDASGLALRRPDLMRLYDLTEGNPLYALEVGRLLADGASFAEALRAPTLQETIALRIATLPDTTQRVLEATALLAVPTIGVVGAALPELAMDECLLAAEDAGVISVSGSDIRFTHPLLRAAVLDRLSGVRRRSLTRSLSHVVTDPDERAVLLGAAADAPDEGVAIALTDAAERAAAKGVLALAVERYQRAVELTADPDARFARLVRLSRCTAGSGDSRAAIAPAEEAARLAATPTDLTRASISAVESIANSLGLAAALERALVLLERIDDDAALEAQVLGLVAELQMFDDLDAADQSCERATDAARRSADAALIAETAVLTGSVAYLRGRRVDIDALRSIALGPDGTIDHGSRLLELLTWSDRISEAIPLARAQLADAQASGHQIHECNASDQLADCLWRAGHWHDALTERRRCTELQTVLAFSYQGSVGEAETAVILAALGDLREAQRLLEPILVSAESEGSADSGGIQAVQCSSKIGFVMLAEQRWSQAAHWLRRARTAAAAISYEDLGGCPFRADLVEALVHLGDLDEARAVAAEHLLLAQRSGTARGLAESSRSMALVLAAEGDHASAITHCEEALEHHDRIDVPFERARTLLVLGGALRRAGRRAQASQRLTEADGIFAELGSAPWQARVASERERLGTQRTDPMVLTPTETQVAELAVSGRTNVEIAAELIISLRTVESNLTRVYRKLGVRSRTELAARLTAKP